MTKSLLKKLKSQHGASFILALLFFMLCSVVASSILMSSVSNAGKINSNKSEHQKYLILSSAVNLIYDDLNNSYYKGKYTYTELNDEYGNTIKKITQKQGEYSGNLSSILLNDFDSIFANEIKTTIDSNADGKYTGVTYEGLKEGAINKHTITISTETGTELDQYEGNPVNVEVTMEVIKESYAVELTAVFEDYKISAEITPNATKPTIPETFTPGESSTSEMKWKLGWITVEGYE